MSAASLPIMDILVNVILTGVGIAMLCYGGSWLVSGGEAVARRLGISSLVIGMTVVAYGTSTPELAASVAAAGKHGDIILGNVVGSNVANVGMVLGTAAILVALMADKRTLHRMMPIMLGFSVLLVGLSVDGEISRLDGVALLVMLGIFTLYMLRGSGRSGNDDNISPPNVSSYKKSIVLIGLGVALLYAGAILTVDNAVVLAASFGIPERIIGITVIAVGTSLPELITSIIAVRRGNTDIGVGNIIGSNIYNILMIMGVAATIAGVQVAPAIFTDYAIMILFSAVLFGVLYMKRLDRPVGLALVIGYSVYLISTVMM